MGCLRGWIGRIRIIIGLNSVRCCRRSGKSVRTFFRRITWMCSYPGSVSCLRAKILCSTYVRESTFCHPNGWKTISLQIAYSTCTQYYLLSHYSDTKNCSVFPCFVIVIWTCCPSAIAWSTPGQLSALSTCSRNCHNIQSLTGSSLTFARSFSISVGWPCAVTSDCLLLRILAWLFTISCPRRVLWWFGRWGWRSWGFRACCRAFSAMRLWLWPCPARGTGQTGRIASCPFSCVRNPPNCGSTSLIFSYCCLWPL